MGLKDVLVRIIGQESVSDAAKKSDSALDALGKRVNTLAKAFVGLTVGAALGKFFTDAIDEAQQAEVGMARLGKAVSNTGNDFEALKPALESSVAAVQAMSTATDDELREALTRMIAVSGDVQGSMKNLALVTDLAAFKNVSLEDAALSVAKAMNGNTTEMNRLGIAGKDATTVLGNARAAFGGFAAEQSKTFSGSLKQITNQWGEFKEAVGTAILSGGEMGSVANTLAGILGGLATWVEKNSATIATFTQAVFATVSAIGSVASAIWDVVGPPLTWLAKVAFVGVVASLDIVTLGLRRAAGVFQEFAGTALEAIGAIVEKGGKILKVFGIDVVQETGTSLRQYGAQLKAQGTAQANQAVVDFKAAMGKLVNVVKGSEGQHTDVVRAGAATRTDIRQKEAISHLDAEIAKQKASQATNELLQKTADLLKKQNASQYAEQWAEIDRNVRRVKGDLSDTLAPADALKKSIDENKAAMEANAKASKDNKEKIEESVSSAISLGRSFVDAGQAAGVLSKEAASALTSVLNMADSLSQFGLGSVQGVIGVVSALANMLSMIGDGPAAKVVRANTAALERLTREVGNLNLSATGKAFQGTESAINATIQAVQSGKIGGGSTAEIGQNAMAFFRRQLAQQGVSSEDAEKLIKELGFGDVFANERSFLQSLPQLKEGFQKTEFGQFGQDFESQLSAIQDRIGFNNAGEKDQLAELMRLAGKFSPAISATGGDATALRGLFDQLINGGLKPEDFGDLSGEQFKDLLKLLIPLADAVGTGADITVSGEKGDKTVSGGKTKAGTFDPNVPPTVPPHDVPGMTPDTVLRTLLGAEVGGPGDGKDLGKALTALLTGEGGVGDPAAFAGLLGSLAGVPTIPDVTIPPLGKRGKLGTGGDHFEQHIGSYIAGDQHHVYQITPPVNVDPQEIASIVRQMMADSYTLQRQAQGLG